MRQCLQRGVAPATTRSTVCWFPLPPRLSSGRPRQYYCWLHGWNNAHNGGQCNVMGANLAYTQQMKASTSPNDTGGNPKIGIQVSYHRSSFDYFSSLSCTPCVQPSPSPSPPSSQACTNSALGALPNEDTRAHTLPSQVDRQKI